MWWIIARFLGIRIIPQAHVQFWSEHLGGLGPLTLPSTLHSVLPFWGRWGSQHRQRISHCESNLIISQQPLPSSKITFPAPLEINCVLHSIPTRRRNYGWLVWWKKFQILPQGNNLSTSTSRSLPMWGFQLMNSGPRYSTTPKMTLRSMVPLWSSLHGGWKTRWTSWYRDRWWYVCGGWSAGSGCSDGRCQGYQTSSRSPRGQVFPETQVLAGKDWSWLGHWRQIGSSPGWVKEGTLNLVCWPGWIMSSTRMHTLPLQSFMVCTHPRPGACQLGRNKGWWPELSHPVSGGAFRRHPEGLWLKKVSGVGKKVQEAVESLWCG